jgi:hypothetical protein
MSWPYFPMQNSYHFPSPGGIQYPYQNPFVPPAFVSHAANTPPQHFGDYANPQMPAMPPPLYRQYVNAVQQK